MIGPPHNYIKWQSCYAGYILQGTAQILATAIFLIFSLIHSDAQSSNYLIHNYTVNDGLPSNECHDIVQDSLGYIWIATDRGLARWDGYEFKVFGLNVGLLDPTCLRLYLDSHQNIWIYTLSGNIYIYQPQSKIIRPYEYNHILIDSFSNIGFLNKIVIDTCGSLIINSLQNGTWKITNTGHIENIIRKSERSFIKVLHSAGNIFLNHFGRRYLPSSTPIENKKIRKNSNFDLQINDFHDVNIKVKGWAMPGRLPKDGFILNQDTITFHILGTNFFASGDSIFTHTSYNNGYRDVVRGAFGNYYALGFLDGTVYEYGSLQNLIDHKYSELLSDIHPTRLLLDRDNNLWLTTTKSGIFYLLRSNIKQLNSNPTADISIGKKHIYTIENNVYLKQYDSSFKPSLLKVFPMEIRDLELIQEEDELVIIGAVSEVYDIIERKFTPLNRYLDSEIKRCNCHGISTASNGHKTVWGHRSLHTYHDFSELPRNEYPKDMGLEHPTDAVTFDSINTIISTTQGVYNVQNHTFSKIKIDSFHPNIRVNALIADNDTIIMASAGKGLYWWNNGRKVHQLVESDGLPSNIVESIHSINNDRLIATTKNGLSIIHSGTNPKVIRNIDSRHGLPSDDVFSVGVKEDSIFVGTAQGLALLRYSDTLHSTATPIIERLVVNDSVVIPHSLYTFHHASNNITIEYKLLDFIQLGDIHYRYKLNNGGWQNTTSTSVSYAALRPGKYRFEIQAKNADGAWGENVDYTFSIKKPWWNTRWFYLSLTSLCIFLGIMISKWRIKNITRSVQLKDELRQLEMAALRAQMNPHFIFNCLNSIQRYIMSNDKKAAMTYLSQFARLIRQTLNASAEQSISLGEEIEMLTNYLDLEKLRHKNKFQYSINATKIIDRLKKKIPPLLIQPFVENAVNHGMKGIGDNIGLITIDFSKSDNDHLLIRVSDNGKWINPTPDQKHHDSKGMAITSRRLALLNFQNSDNVHISQSEEKAGTVIEITVKLS